MQSLRVIEPGVRRSTTGWLRSLPQARGVPIAHACPPGSRLLVHWQAPRQGVPQGPLSSPQASVTYTVVSCPVRAATPETCQKLTQECSGALAGTARTGPVTRDPASERCALAKPLRGLSAASRLRLPIPSFPVPFGPPLLKLVKN